MGVRLPAVAPFDGAGVLAFLAARVVTGVEEVGDGAYRRTALVDRVPAVVEMAVEEDAVVACAGAAGRAREIFDLDADPRAIGAVLGGLAAPRPGLRVPGCWDPFELAVRAVLGQQVTVAAANRLAARLVEAHGVRLRRARGTLTHLFPAPEALAEAPLGGMPAARARAIRALAAAVAAGDLRLDPAQPAATRDALLALPGIGPWTVDYIALRALRDPDAFPTGDVALRAAAGGLTSAALTARAEAWRPYRGYAAVHLWASLASPKGSDPSPLPL